MAIEFDKTWHQRCYGDTPMPEDLCLATEYHSRAAITMTIWWILSDMPVSPDFITDMITKMRDAGLSHMLCQRARAVVGRRYNHRLEHLLKRQLLVLLQIDLTPALTCRSRGGRDHIVPADPPILQRFHH